VLKPQWLSKTAIALEGFYPIFVIGFALIFVALLYYLGLDSPGTKAESLRDVVLSKCTHSCGVFFASPGFS